MVEKRVFRDCFCKSYTPTPGASAKQRLLCWCACTTGQRTRKFGGIFVEANESVFAGEEVREGKGEGSSFVEGNLEDLAIHETWCGSYDTPMVEILPSSQHQGAPLICSDVGKEDGLTIGTLNKEVTKPKEVAVPSNSLSSESYIREEEDDEEEGTQFHDFQSSGGRKRTVESPNLSQRKHQRMESFTNRFEAIQGDLPEQILSTPLDFISEEPVSSVVDGLLDADDEEHLLHELHQVQEGCDITVTTDADADADAESAPDNTKSADSPSSDSSGEYSDIGSDDEEVDMVMERIVDELSARPDDDPLLVITDFLEKHDLPPEQVLSLVSNAEPPSLGSIVRALITFMRTTKGQSFLPRRKPVVQVDDFNSVVELIRSSKKIVVLSGAGVSVSCGIPDFRSPGGLYDTVRQRFGLEEPQALFDIQYFKKSPKPFFTLAKDIFPGKSSMESCGYFFHHESVL